MRTYFQIFFNQQHWEKQFVFFVLLIGQILFSAELTSAQNVADGKRKSTTCAACHGQGGVSNNPLWPNLAKQKEQYIIKQLRAFKTADRKDPLMSPMALTLSEQDIMDLAAYYSSLEN